MNKKGKAAVSVLLLAAAIDACRNFPMAQKALHLLDENETPSNSDAVPEVMLYPPRISDIPVMCVQDLDNNVYGPLAKSEIVECIRDGRIDSHSRVCFRLGKTLKGKERYSDWIEFGSTGWKDMCRPAGPKAISQYTPRPTAIEYSMRFWILDDAGTDHGPFTTAAIPTLMKEGILHRNTLAYVEGGPWDWLPVTNFRPISQSMMEKNHFDEIEV
jgi:hypothetical protein